MADAQNENKSATSSSGASAEPAGNNKLVMLLTLVNLVVCLAIAGVLVVSLKKEKQASSVADIKVEEEENAHGDGHGDAKKDAHGGGHGGGHGGKEVKKAGVRMMQLEQFTVNLSSPGGSAQKFVRVNISLEVPSEEVEGEVTTKAPQVRNTIIDLFNSKRPSDLSTVDGREYLKEEIRTALNSFMNVGKIKGVYFTNFAVTN